MKDIMLGSLNGLEYKVGRFGFVFYKNDSEWIKSDNSRNDILLDMIAEIRQSVGGVERRKLMIKEKQDLMTD